MTLEELKKIQDKVYAVDRYDAGGNYVPSKSQKKTILAFHERAARAYRDHGKIDQAKSAEECARKLRNS